MKNIILFSLALSILSLTHSFAQSIEDFDVVKVVPDESSLPKEEVVQDIAIRIAPTTTSADTNAEVILPALTKPSIDFEGIKKLLREHVPQFHTCYQNVLDTSDKPETLSGNLNLKFKIATNGKVEKSEITSQDFHSAIVQACIKNVLAGIQFPKNEKSISVNQPMNLYTSKR